MAMIGFLGIALVGAVFSYIASSVPHQESINLLNGQASKSYEDEFDRNLVHRDTSLNLWNSMGYFLFKEGKKGVLIGQDGWLFTDEEFAYGGDFQNNIEQNKKYIRSVANNLSGNNVRLLIVPIPSKARIYKDKLGKYKFPSYWNTQYEGLIDFFEKEKIEFLDLFSIFSKNKEQNIFLKTDTHWTPLGARTAALKIAYGVEKKWPYMSWKTESVRSVKGDMIEHEGDLMRYTVNGEVADWFGLKKDSFYKWTTEVLGEGDLFGDKALPVTLVGTSYSANEMWNFEGFLKEALAADVLNVADEGLGPFETMHSYLESDVYQKNSLKLVVWELPERYLPVLPDFIEENR